MTPVLYHAAPTPHFSRYAPYYRRYSGWRPASYVHVSRGNRLKSEDSLSALSFIGSPRVRQEITVGSPASMTVPLPKIDAPQILVSSGANKLWISTRHKILLYLTTQNSSLVQSSQRGGWDAVRLEWLLGVPHLEVPSALSSHLGPGEASSTYSSVLSEGRHFPHASWWKKRLESTAQV